MNLRKLFNWLPRPKAKLEFEAHVLSMNLEHNRDLEGGSRCLVELEVRNSPSLFFASRPHLVTLVVREA